ncbi:urea ABC transporter permease subunit UrtB [Gordonia sp. Z-3]|uniref:urea ABC transporter permease subunit UrtB n=1 Tax=Gordonia sp. Z-3 TaxID=3115408 RepID=UPI002E2C3CEC|nr:urea ABC transporter permease subunit UrtB [Gordonia sp. Z-3]MED5803110.1 urea ABC transporter permease subunit UrtB [Gordonia sp. Z-3]
METLIGQLFIGLSLGSILLLVALGLSLTFGQMGVINMAHGEIMMAGSYTAYVIGTGMGSSGASLLVSFIVGAAVGALIGGLLEILLISRMYDRPLDTLLVTFGVALIMQQLARQIFGAPAVSVTPPSWLLGEISVLGAAVPKARVFILVLAVVAVLAVTGAMRMTPLGRRIRAVIDNRQLAVTSGISSRRTDLSTFMIGSALAGIAGVALTLIGPVSPMLGQSYIVDAFLVVVVGGLGQIKGAVIAAFGLGLLNSFIEFGTTASTAKVLVFLVVIVFLQVRPQGLFTVKTRSLA